MKYALVALAVVLGVFYWAFPRTVTTEIPVEKVVEKVVYSRCNCHFIHTCAMWCDEHKRWH